MSFISQFDKVWPTREQNLFIDPQRSPIRYEGPGSQVHDLISSWLVPTNVGPFLQTPDEGMHILQKGLHHSRCHQEEAKKTLLDPSCDCQLKPSASVLHEACAKPSLRSGQFQTAECIPWAWELDGGVGMNEVQYVSTSSIKLSFKPALPQLA